MKAIVENQINKQNASKDLLNLNDGCFMGDLKYLIDLESFESSYLKGHLWVESFETLLRFLIPYSDKF